jgi:hypothetical protein
VEIQKGFPKGGTTYAQLTGMLRTPRGQASHLELAGYCLEYNLLSLRLSSSLPLIRRKRWVSLASKKREVIGLSPRTEKSSSQI